MIHALQLIWATLLIVAVWWVPGAVLGVAAGLPRRSLPVTAPVIGVGFLALCVRWFPRFAIPWTLWSAALATLLAAAALLLARHAWAARRHGATRRAELDPAEVDHDEVGRAEVTPAEVTHKDGAANMPREVAADVHAEAGATTHRPAPGSRVVATRSGIRDHVRTTLRAAVRPPSRATLRDLAWYAAALAPAAIVGGSTWRQGTLNLQAINQDWDIAWHANMVRLVADSHLSAASIAKPFEYYTLAPADIPISPYPIAMHAILALVWPLTTINLPQFLNTYLLVMICLQLPISTMALTRTLTDRRVAVALAGAVSSWLVAFPYDLLWRGPLIPLFAALLFVGPVVWLVVHGVAPQLATAPERRAQRFARFRPVLDSVRYLGAAALGAVAIVSVQPAGALVVAVVLLPWYLLRLLPSGRPALRGTVLLAGLGVVAGALSWPVLRAFQGATGTAGTGINWAPDFGSLSEAFAHVLQLTHSKYSPTLLAILVVIGALTLLRASRLWYLPPLVGLAVLSAYTMGSTDRWVLDYSNLFYDDQFRIFGIYIMLALPLIGLACDALVDLVWRATQAARPALASTPRVERLSTRSVRWQPVAAATMAVVVTIAGLAGVAPMISAVTRLGYLYSLTGYTVSAGERDIMEGVADEVPKDGMILNDWCDGSVWLYALGGRMPMLRHFNQRPDADQALLLDHFAQLATRSDVRAAAARLGITHVYVGRGFVRNTDKRVAGLAALDDLPFLTKVSGNADAQLYRIDWDRVPGGQPARPPAGVQWERQPGVPGLWGVTPPSFVPADRVC